MTRSLRLGAENSLGQTEELMFTVRSSPIAKKWSDCILSANAHSSLRERKRWYNFPGHKNSDGNFIVEQINRCVERINKVFPELIPVRLDVDQAQESVNRIHTFFADTHLDKSKVNSETFDAWNDLNNWLHAYEAFIRNHQPELATGLPASEIFVTWSENFKAPLEPEDYQHFTVAKKFGTCYVNYCQTGRHLFDIFLAQDEAAADEHIRPLRLVSADTYIWLGPTSDPARLAHRQEAIRVWFKKNEKKFNALGFFWGDPQLAIGWIPVADLQAEIGDLSGQRELINKFSKMDQVSSLEIVEQ